MATPMNEREEVKLKPCPFCGTSSPEWNETDAMMWCPECGVSVHGATKHLAAKTWNYRPAEASIAKHSRIEAYEKARDATCWGCRENHSFEDGYHTFMDVDNAENCKPCQAISIRKLLAAEYQ